ncbi:hypothetical protein [Scytonema sp. PCC 10023]|uniref:hypothetical protein n=1 Tax=Scytonema sp. PCC 10023 TaxID=1680591 RepID=UPI0039C5F42F
MSKIKYPTLDLFVYNLAEGLASKIEDYWVTLPDKLKEKGYSTKINDKDSQRLDFCNTISAAVDGFYSRVNFEDTNCLRYCCSVDKKIELSDIELNITQIKHNSNQRFSDSARSGRFANMETFRQWLSGANLDDIRVDRSRSYPNF